MRSRESGFQQRFYPLVELLEGGFADDHFTVDEKGRRAVDLEHILGVFLDRGDLVLHRLVLQAILDRLRAEPGLPPDQLQRVAGLLDQLVLLLEHDVDDGEIFCRVVLGDVARQDLAREALNVFFQIREVPGLKKKPSTAELLDWLKQIGRAHV